MTMPLVEALGRIEEITTQVQALSPRTDASAATRFAQTLAAQGATLPPVAAASNAGVDANGVTGEAIVAKAKEYLGVPYVLGGNDKSGIDCSGLVQQVLGELGIDVPRRVSQQQSVGVEVPSLAEAQPGDLIVTNNADHIVIYAGDGMIVHAPYEGRTVSYQKNYLSEGEIQTIRRVVPDASAAPSGAAGAVAGAGAASGFAGLAGLAGLAGMSGSSGLTGASGQALLAALTNGGLAGSLGAGSGMTGGLSLLGALGLGTGGSAAGGSGAAASSGLTDLVLAAQVQSMLRSAS